MQQDSGSKKVSATLRIRCRHCRRSETGDSDLLTVYNAYSAWRKVCHSAGASEQIFCHKNYLSSQTLSNIEELKAQLLTSIVDAGFVILDEAEKSSLNRYVFLVAPACTSLCLLQLTQHQSPTLLQQATLRTSSGAIYELQRQRAGPQLRYSLELLSQASRARWNRMEECRQQPARQVASHICQQGSSRVIEMAFLLSYHAIKQQVELPYLPLP